MPDIVGCRIAVGDSDHVGMAIEELEPGKQSSPAHYHVSEEADVYLLEGVLTVRIGAVTHEKMAGTISVFPPARRSATPS